MEIRKTNHSDIPRLHEIFAEARAFMASTGNPHQWAANYPSCGQIEDDILRGESYVCVTDGHIVATFVMRLVPDPTYDEIYDGSWLNDKPYATIHRIASSGEAKGIFHAVNEFVLQHCGTIRIDTHRDNKVMQHILRRAHFRYCGIIHCWNGDERLAYQLG